MIKRKIQMITADDNVELINKMNDYFKKQKDIEIVGCASDGEAAFELIVSKMPDIAIIDIVMPQLDGIGVLEKVNSAALKKRPVFIIISAPGLDKITQTAIALGAEYYIIKPFDLDMLTTRIRQLINGASDSAMVMEGSVETNLPETYKNNYSCFTEVTKLLYKAGIPPHIKGYQYLKRAIIMTIMEPQIINSVTKQLYPLLAKEFDTTASGIERAIRHAIEKAAERSAGTDNSENNYCRSFGKCITNSEFIAASAEKIHIGYRI
jgi:two-component system, response regulator, stage 0 sporulation protein A